MLKSILFGLFSVALFSIVAVGSTLLAGCGGESSATDPGIREDAHCIPGEPRDFICADGTVVTVVCAEDGTSYSTSSCPLPDAGSETEASDAVLDCGPNQPVGHVISTNCCDDGSTGYTVCQASGQYEGCYGCQESVPDAGGIYPVLAVTLSEIGTTNIIAGFSQTLVEMEACAFKNVRIYTAEFKLAGGPTEGNNGTLYFSNHTLQSGELQALMGPIELTINPGDVETRRLQFSGNFEMNAGTCQTYTLRSDLAEHADAPSEFIGQSYKVQLVGLGVDVLDENGQPDYPAMDDGILWFNTIGPSLEVRCNPGTYNPCACSDGSIGQAICSVSYEPLACDCS